MQFSKQRALKGVGACSSSNINLAVLLCNVRFEEMNSFGFGFGEYNGKDSQKQSRKAFLQNIFQEEFRKLHKKHIDRFSH